MLWLAFNVGGTNDEELVHPGLEGDHSGKYCNGSSIQFGPETECCGLLSLPFQPPHLAGIISRILVFSVFFICFSLSSSQASPKRGTMSFSLLTKLNLPALS